jgi:outer membrane protein
MNRFVFIVAVFISLPCTLQSQDSSVIGLPDQWRLEDCISYAKKKNITLATLRLTTNSTEEDLLQAKAGILPNLTGSASQTLANGKSSSAGTVQSQTNFSGSYGVNSSMTLYNGGYLKNDIRLKQFSVQSANLYVQEAENDLTLSITQAFFNILLAKETMASFESLLATAEAQLTQGRQKYDAGSIARKDLLLLESQVATDRYNLINATNAFKQNTVTLKQYLLLPSSYELIVSAPATIPVQVALASLPEAQREAQQTRPEVKNKEVQIKISETELEKVKASVKPIISAGAALSTGYGTNQGTVFTSQIGNNFYQTLGVTMGVPIYSRRVNRSSINRSRIQLKQTQLALFETKTVLNQQVEQAYLNLLNAQSEYSAAAIQFKANEEVYNIANEQLKLGAINTLELLQQKNAYVQAMQALTQAKYRAALYNKLYAFYMGIPVTF